MIKINYTKTWHTETILWDLVYDFWEKKYGEIGEFIDNPKFEV